MNSLTDMKRVIRLNKYETDDWSEHCPDRAIASRSDIRSIECEHISNIHNNGAIDGKVTSGALVKDLTAFAISGPSCDDQPCFSFSTAVHQEESKYISFLPDLWDFDWVKMKPF